jgi:hypothetical protein
MAVAFETVVHVQMVGRYGFQIFDFGLRGAGVVLIDGRQSGANGLNPGSGQRFRCRQNFLAVAGEVGGWSIPWFAGEPDSTESGA